MDRAVRVIYGPTGGRFPFMSGVIDAVESFLSDNDISIYDRIGVSGGSLTAAIKASGTPFPEWMASASSLRHEVEIGGSKSRLLKNLWWFASSGGLLNSKVVLKRMFHQVAPRPPQDAPCYAVSWCSSARKGVAFSLGEDLDIATCLLASCALPFAFSPVRVLNKRLPLRVQQLLGVTHKPNLHSTFKDGGLASDWVGDLVLGTPLDLPTVVVSIEGDPPKSGNPLTRLALTVIKSKTLDGIENASRSRPVHLIDISCPAPVNEFAARFDITKEEGLWLYGMGLTEGQKAIVRMGRDILASFPRLADPDLTDSDNMMSSPIQASL